jgi:hypothetical protein
LKHCMTAYAYVAGQIMAVLPEASRMNILHSAASRSLLRPTEQMKFDAIATRVFLCYNDARAIADQRLQRFPGSYQCDPLKH